MPYSSVCSFLRIYNNEEFLIIDLIIGFLSKVFYKEKSN